MKENKYNDPVFFEKYSQMARSQQGLSAAVYTQLSDVEEEVNGLVTYDRKVVKLSPETMRKIVNVE